MHYSPDCLCESCKQAGNRRYVGGGVYNINNIKNNMSTKDVIAQAEYRLETEDFMLGTTLDRDSEYLNLPKLKSFLSSYTKDLLQSVVTDWNNARDDDSCECDNCHRTRKYLRSLSNIISKLK